MSRSKSMPHRTTHQGMGLRIGIGFVAVLLLMLALGVTGVRAVAEANQRLRDITQNNNVKTELANEMSSALRERALSMHILPLLTDSFDKDDELQRFSVQGARYVRARQQAQDMPLSAEERVTLARIVDLTREAQPEVQAVMEMASVSDNRAEILERISTVAVPMQRAINEQVNAFLELQRTQTTAALLDADTSSARVRALMLGLGTSALLIGGAIAAFVSQRVARQADQLTIQAMYDPLTGLANRALLHDRIDQAIKKAHRAGSSFAVALMDLDRFKEVNDVLGHDVGDELLREVGRRLIHTVRAEDTVARLGGDEYVVVLNGLDAQAAAETAAKVLAALVSPFYWQKQKIDIGGSLGLSLYPSQCEDTSALIRCADIAMYEAKRTGAGFALYSPDLERVSGGDLSLRSELRDAIQADQLLLHYQPQVSHATGRVVGLEALVRWLHPQRGFLPPDQFIGLAEETGLIGALTQWVLRTSLAHLAELHRQGFELRMAVNLSARSLQDLALPASIGALLEESGVAPRHLCLEITESAVMANPGDGLTILTELDRMGVTLAIDDFGTGYSSLAYLKRLPVDELKIDKSFVMEMAESENDAVIVRSTIDLAHNLGLKVIAEGVEDAAVWDQLGRLGCDQSQGYYMARPMAAEALATWLRSSPWSKGKASDIASSTPSAQSMNLAERV